MGSSSKDKKEKTDKSEKKSKSDKSDKREKKSKRDKRERSRSESSASLPRKTRTSRAKLSSIDPSMLLNAGAASAISTAPDRHMAPLPPGGTSDANAAAEMAADIQLAMGPPPAVPSRDGPSAANGIGTVGVAGNGATTATVAAAGLTPEPGPPALKIIITNGRAPSPPAELKLFFTQVL